MMSDVPSLRGTLPWSALPLLLAGVLVAVFVPTCILSPEGSLNWLLEVGPGIIGMVALALTYRRFPMSRFVYLAVFLHILILVYGGYYTYAKAPLGEWMRIAFHFQRNNYDKIGHLAFGFFPVFVLREVFLRVTGVRRGPWLGVILVLCVFGLAALYEIIEWWAALALDPAGGDRFLGTQGDVWDSQSDMLFGGVGAVLGLLTLAGVHDRSMRRLVVTLRTD